MWQHMSRGSPAPKIFTLLFAPVRISVLTSRSIFGEAKGSVQQTSFDISCCVNLMLKPALNFAVNWDSRSMCVAVAKTLIALTQDAFRLCGNLLKLFVYAM